MVYIDLENALNRTIYTYNSSRKVQQPAATTIPGIYELLIQVVSMTGCLIILRLFSNGFMCSSARSIWI